MRALAHIEQIEWKRPIQDADKIELVGVLGWQCVARKDEFNVGDKCVYIEIDSVVDKDNPVFAFLEPRKYTIKTIKLRGELSQGIVFPAAVFGDDYLALDIGTDVTDKLNIQEIPDDIPAATPQRQKQNRSMLRRWFDKIFKTEDKRFPNWITKTDEVRIQNAPGILVNDAFRKLPMVVTEKLDGTSSTFGLRRRFLRDEYVVCSRNKKISLKNGYSGDGGSVYREMADKHNMRSVLRSLRKKFKAKRVVIQGEIIGEGIQKNKYGIEGHRLYAFNLVVDGKRVDSVEAAKVLKDYNIDWVPILDANYRLPDDVPVMLEYADGKSVLSDTLREGVVIRDHSNTVSFKAVSNKFLIKHGL